MPAPRAAASSEATRGTIPSVQRTCELQVWLTTSLITTAVDDGLTVTLASDGGAGSWMLMVGAADAEACWAAAGAAAASRMPAVSPASRVGMRRGWGHLVLLTKKRSTIESPRRCRRVPAQLLAMEVTFGHGARHLFNSGVTADQVEAAICRALDERETPPVGTFSRHSLMVRGVLIEYHVYRQSVDMLHVGTYFPVNS